MISDLKEKEDELMMRNGVNSIWMQRRRQKNLCCFSLVFSFSLSVVFTETFTLTMKLLFYFFCILI